MRLVDPLAGSLIRRLAHTRVRPHHVVILHTLVGYGAAWLLAGGGYGRMLAAAVLLQVKTLLDNVDGGLARATGRVTEMGRYLDTLLDLTANAAIFWALAQHGPPVWAFAAFLVLTLVLSAEFNAAELYMTAHDPDRLRSRPSPPPGAPRPLLALLRGAYAALLAPQDRLLRALDRRLFRLAAGVAWDDAAAAARLRWSDRFSTAALVDLGLSTQLFILGLCAAAGSPYAYVMIVLLQLPYLALVQVVRVARYRRGAA